MVRAQDLVDELARLFIGQRARGGGDQLPVKTQRRWSAGTENQIRGPLIEERVQQRLYGQIDRVQHTLAV